MSISKAIGILLTIVGIAAAMQPQWFGPLTGGVQDPADLFQAVERRVRGGMVLGVGLAFLAVPALRPWSTSIPTAIFYFIIGALAARLYGMLIDGAVPKQWLLVAVEGVIMVVAALWLWRSTQVGGR